MTATDIASAKAALRTRRAAERAARSAGDRDAARTAIRHHVLARVAAEGWTCVAGYAPLRSEPGSHELLAGLHAAAVRVLVPVTLPDRDLDWAHWSPDAVSAPLGLGAIAAAQLVLVPAFAVGSDGMRLGRGGGSYDRALARCSPDALTAALLFEGEQVEQVPHDAWDRPVRSVVTPTGWNTALRPAG